MPQCQVWGILRRAVQGRGELMQAIPLGLVTVPTAGTPVALSLSAGQLALCPPDGRVAKVEVWADPGMTGASVSVKQGGTVLAKLPKPSGSFTEPWSTPESNA